MATLSVDGNAIFGLFRMRAFTQVIPTLSFRAKVASWRNAWHFERSKTAQQELRPPKGVIDLLVPTVSAGTPVPTLCVE